MDQPLQQIRDITPGTPWPEHLVNLICRNNSQEPNATENTQNDVPIKLDEITACICHVAMIEIGFVPSYIDIDPTAVRFMTEKERIVTLSSELPPHQRNSNTGVLTGTYRGICENPKNLITHTFRRDVENQDSAMELDNQQQQLSPEETEPLYVYTTPVDVIMLAQNGTLSLHGHIRSEGSSTHAEPDSQIQPRVQSTQVDVNIRNYLPSNCSVKNFDKNALLPSRQWLNQIQLDGSRLSDALKVQFGKTLLTLVDGISFEPSLQHLSPELIMKVFQFLPIEDVCQVTQVSHYMYAVSDSDLFWLERIERDFPAEAPGIRARFLITNSPQTTSSDKEGGVAPSPSEVKSTATTNSGTGEETVYREYIRLYHRHRPPRRRLFHPIYRRLLIPRRSFTPLLGFHPPLLRRFW